MGRGFWFSRWSGTGTPADPWIPEVVVTARADFPDVHSRLIDLRAPAQIGTANGWCIVGTSRARMAWQNKPRVWGLGTSLDSVLPDDFVDAVNTQFGRSFPHGRTVRDFARYVLRRVPVAGDLRPDQSGTFRIVLDAGDDDAGDPPTVDAFRAG